jgi:hypothetical protein
MGEDYPGQAYFHANNRNIRIAEEMWAKKSKCWEWYGVKDKRGYGQTGRNDKYIGAHRLSWTLYRGEIPKGMHVLHRCDNPPCVNPDHLFLGTNSENQLDSVSKGRHPNTRKTHCPKGHPYTLENILPGFNKGRPSRSCRACRRLEWKRRVI